MSTSRPGATEIPPRQQQRLIPSQQQQQQQHLGDYVLGAELGRGSFAKVYLATNKQTGEQRAVKKIQSTRLSAKMLQNLESEISILRNFQHDNIVKLYGIQKTRSHVYLVLEFCGGGDLHKYIRTHGKLKESVAQHFMRHLAAGLAFLYARQLIHRDIKPQNLLLTARADNACLKIADFGFARHLEAASLAETLCGSPLYMAPEILTFQRYDAKADLWSAGAVLFEMIAGRPPYNGQNQSELVHNIRTKEIRLPSGTRITQSCVAIIQMLLQRTPSRRATFERFLQAEFLRAPSSSQPLSGSSERATHVVTENTAVSDTVPTRQRSVSSPAVLPKEVGTVLEAGKSREMPALPAQEQHFREQLAQKKQGDSDQQQLFASGGPLVVGHNSQHLPPSNYFSKPLLLQHTNGVVQHHAYSPPTQVAGNLLPSNGALTMPFQRSSPPNSPFEEPLKASPPNGGNFTDYMLDKQRWKWQQYQQHRNHQQAMIEAGQDGRAVDVSRGSVDVSGEWCVVDNVPEGATGSWHGVANNQGALQGALRSLVRGGGRMRANTEPSMPPASSNATTGSSGGVINTDRRLRRPMLSPAVQLPSEHSSPIWQQQTQDQAGNVHFASVTQQPYYLHDLSSNLTGAGAPAATATQSPIKCTEDIMPTIITMLENMELLGRCAMAVARIGDNSASLVLHAYHTCSHQSDKHSSLAEASVNTFIVTERNAESVVKNEKNSSDKLAASLTVASSSSASPLRSPTKVLQEVDTKKDDCSSDEMMDIALNQSSQQQKCRSRSSISSSSNSSASPVPEDGSDEMMAEIAVTPGGSGGLASSSSSYSNAKELRGSDLKDDKKMEPLIDALLLYLKSMGLVKRALELGRSLLENVLPNSPVNVTTVVTSADSKSTQNLPQQKSQVQDPSANVQQMSGSYDLKPLLSDRTKELHQWLSSQFNVILDRAQQCRKHINKDSVFSSPGSRPQQQQLTPAGGTNAVQDSSSRTMTMSTIEKTVTSNDSKRAEQRMYVAAMQLARKAAVKEVLGNTELSLKMYQHGQLLIEALLLEPNLPDGDRAVLMNYDRGFQMRIEEMRQTLLQNSRSQGNTQSLSGEETPRSPDLAATPKILPQTFLKAMKDSEREMSDDDLTVPPPQPTSSPSVVVPPPPLMLQHQFCAGSLEDAPIHQIPGSPLIPEEGSDALLLDSKGVRTFDHHPAFA